MGTRWSSLSRIEGRVAPMWHRHPAIRSRDELALDERAADEMRNSMGSWGFAVHDDETNLEADRVVKAIHELMKEIHAHVVASPAPHECAGRHDRRRPVSGWAS